jgi:hypothetical protein
MTAASIRQGLPSEHVAAASATRSFVSLEGRLGVAGLEMERGEPLHRHTRIFPGVGVAADVAEADRRVGVDLITGLAGTVTEGKVFRKLPVFWPCGSRVVGLDHHRHEERYERLVELKVADRQIALALDVEVDLPPRIEKTGRCVADFQ